MLPHTHRRTGVQVSSRSHHRVRSDVLTAALLTVGCVASESSSVDSAEPVPQSRRPLTAAVKASPESTRTPPFAAESAALTGQLVHVFTGAALSFWMHLNLHWPKRSWSH